MKRDIAGGTEAPVTGRNLAMGEYLQVGQGG